MSNYTFGICNPKRSLYVHSAPQFRLELQQNPYDNKRIPLIPNSTTDPNFILTQSNSRPITQFDLNMRRKVEILKYSSNRISSQTNNQTKSQRWSQLISGNNYYDPSSNSYIYNRLDVCPEKHTLTTGCNVPGNAIFLYQNNDAPLYNYSTQHKSYAIYPAVIQPNWTSVYIENVDISNSITKTIAEIYIQNTNNSTYNYNFTTPLALYFSGSISNNTNVKIKLFNIKLNVYYSEKYLFSLSPSNIESADYLFDLSNAHGINYSFESGIFLNNYVWDNIQLINNGNFMYTFNITGTVLINNYDNSKLQIDSYILYCNYNNTAHNNINYIENKTDITKTLYVRANQTNIYMPGVITCQNG